MMKTKATSSSKISMFQLFFLTIVFFSVSAVYFTNRALEELNPDAHSFKTNSRQRQLSSVKDMENIDLKTVNDEKKKKTVVNDVTSDQMGDVIQNQGSQQTYNAKTSVVEESKKRARLEKDQDSASHDLDTYYGFVRIPKTGSTSLAVFLTYNTGFKSIDHFIADVPTFLEERKHENAERTNACVFGSYKASKKLLLAGTKPSPIPLHELNCSHRTYNAINRYFRKVIPALKEPFLPTTDPSSLLSFTIVREPYERWKSYFNYVYQRRHKNKWKEDASDEQWECILRQDFPRWLELVGTEKVRPWMQYEFLDYHDIDNAIALIQGSKPKVHVYLNECFETSLYMMSEVLSIPTSIITDFVNSDQFHKNPSVSSTTEKIDENDIEEKLRENAKIWFQDEYKFYNAAVQEFQRNMASSKTIQSSNHLMQTSCMYRKIVSEVDAVYKTTSLT